MSMWDLVATERRRLADELDALTEQEWTTQSQCEAWTVEEVAAHLLTPFETSNLRFVLAMIRRRGQFDKAIIDLTDRVHSTHTRSEVVAKLRAHAENRWTPPRTGDDEGPALVLAEIVVHGQDIRRAIGRDHDIPATTIEAALAGISDTDIRTDYAQRIGISLATG